MKVEELRRLLQQYDDGMITESEVECYPVFHMMEMVREQLLKGEELKWFTLGCVAFERPPVIGEVVIGTMTVTIRPKPV